ncbi:2,3-diaminopropionate biosynthesis protein SbnA [Rhodococcus sp. 27YEA15]|uniref:pyridoxal-phosphate dependent enzyme n=1 Tax=Rhodococcus sp. 27YEA15 TaxID=3156259 RepID=UPI003C7BEB5A
MNDALATGRLHRGQTVVESSSGNLGLALARACTTRGLRFICVADTRTNRATISMMRALGADVRIIDSPDPETGELLTARIREVKRIVADNADTVNLDQYSNAANPRAHRDGTMTEIVDALDGKGPDHLFAATSTTGTVSGCRQLVDARKLPTRIVAVDVEGSALFGGPPGPRTLPGMGAGQQTSMSRHSRPSSVVRVSEQDCIRGCRLLARREGVLAGASTGGVVAALRRSLPNVDAGETVVLIGHDSGISYAETVYDDRWVEGTLHLNRTEALAWL